MWITLNDATSGAVLVVNTSNLLMIQPSTTGSTGTSIQDVINGSDGTSNDIISVSQSPAQIMALITDGTWRAFTAGWNGATPNTTIYINMEHVIYCAAENDSWNLNGSVLYWSITGQVEVACPLAQVAQNIGR